MGCILLSGLSFLIFTFIAICFDKLNIIETHAMFFTFGAVSGTLSLLVGTAVDSLLFEKQANTDANNNKTDNGE